MTWFQVNDRCFWHVNHHGRWYRIDGVVVGLRPDRQAPYLVRGTDGGLYQPRASLLNRIMEKVPRMDRLG